MSSAIQPHLPDLRPLRVVVHRTGSLGDTLVALPALRLVRASFPNAQIILLGNRPVSASAAPAAAVLDSLGLVQDHVVYTSQGALAAAREIHRLVRRLRPQVVVSLSSRTSALVALRDYALFKLAGVPRVLGLMPWQRGLRRVSAGGPEARHEREAQRLARLLRALGSVNLNDPQSWQLDPAWPDRAGLSQLIPEWKWEPSYFCIAIGTKAPSNDWGQQRWKEALAELARQAASQRLICIGSSEDFARSAELLAHWPGGGENLCGRLDLRQTAAVLVQSRLLLGHDSGPMHLAAALGVPAVAVFSRRNPLGKWFPLGPNHATLYSQVACAGCGLATCARHDNLCTQQVSAAAFAQQAAQRMQASAFTDCP